ncbi:type I restriction modification DNA specificity domain protein [Francisella philomiragia]|uniref:restriction endonuclease subunit S n=1 Tax=Francisella philomiragia TaxID=28110 RepID=UPI0005A5700C|nr:restriction endonuclease subunit S [Francisella philomiragia]AJI55969.1 type I restriction modification DNA specificity domain protein [Francisella philomiragia]MBK2252172.1 restriction endonuclease subunit S [Francisella philomiragia]
MSELYKLPAGWEWKKLGEVSKKIFAGGDKPDQVSEYSTKELPIPIYANGIKNDGLYGYSNVYKVDEECVTISARGTIGYSVVRNEKFLPIVRLIVVIPNLDLLSKFIKNYLDFEIVSNTGSSIPQLTVPAVKSIQIPLPPLAEQKRIVAKLDSLFEKIDKAIELHQQNITNANTLMASTLDKTFKKLEGECSKNKLENIADLVDGDRGRNYPKKSDFLEEGYCLFLNAKNVTKHGFKFNEKQFITEQRDSLLRKGKLEKGDIVITTRGTIGNVAIYDENFKFKSIRINSGMAIVRIKNDMDLLNRFLYKYFVSPQFISYLNKVQTGSAQPQITIKILQNATVVVPPLQAQQQTVEYLDSIAIKIDKIKQLNEQKLENLKALKASILDKAFRGEL